MSTARFRRRDLDAIEANIRGLQKRKVPGVKSIPRKRLRAVMRYRREYDLETWDKIARRKGVLSYSLLLHELSKLDYLEKQGIDPLNDAERTRYFVPAHVEALRTEHEFLMKLAQTRYPKTRFNLGTFVAFNPSVHPRTNQLDVAIIQRYWNHQVKTPGRMLARQRYRPSMPWCGTNGDHAPDERRGRKEPFLEAFFISHHSSRSCICRGGFPWPPAKLFGATRGCPETDTGQGAGEATGTLARAPSGSYALRHKNRRSM